MLFRTQFYLRMLSKTQTFFKTMGEELNTKFKGSKRMEHQISIRTF
jgi:hypothetical protein